MKKAIFLLSIFILVFTTCKKDKEIEEEIKDPATEYIEAINEGAIGAGGGVVTLDNSSELKGAILTIPPGALTQTKNISIQINNKIRPTIDTLADIIDIKPDGLQFNKPVTLKIPVKNSIQHPMFYYFIPDSDIVKQIPFDVYNQNGRYIEVSLNHFSRYVVTDNINGKFDAFLFNTATGIKANIQFGAVNEDNQLSLSWIPVKVMHVLPCGEITARAHLDRCASNWGTDANAYHTHIILTLKQDAWLFLNNLKTIEYEIRRIGNNTSNLSVKVTQLKPDKKIIFESGVLAPDKREEYFNGKSLIFDFGIQPQSGKNYYLEMTWYLAQDPSFSIDTKITSEYTLNTYNTYPAWTTSNMSNSDPDKNKNLVGDSYDVVPNSAPATPANPNPATNATGISTSPNLTWDCSDPDGDALIYDVYFGTDNPPATKVSTAQTGKSFTRSGLTAGATYFWKVVAKDSKGANTEGPVWKFTTQTASGSAPVADFTASKTSITKGETIQFTDKSTNTPTSWLWTFGDGTTSNLQNPIKTYSTAGNYTVSLKATNSFGNNTKTITNYITVSQTGSSPVADFTASKTNPTKGEAIQFADKSTNSPTSWLWTFGDGTTSTQQNPSKTYNTIGTYTVTLKATNNFGNSTKTINITVKEQSEIKYGELVYQGRTYKTIIINGKEWMAENLAYLPFVYPSSSGSTTEPRYYVYNYQGTDVAAAKQNANYTTYGVLYNWPAAKAACPQGWHLPTNAELTALENYLIANGFNYDGTTTENKIAKSLAAKTNWITTLDPNAISNNLTLNNKSGFSALPGGARVYDDGSFNYMGTSGSWWCSENSTNKALKYNLYHDDVSGFGRYNSDKDWGISVRCVRD